MRLRRFSGLVKGATAGAIGIGAGAIGAGIASAKLGNIGLDADKTVGSIIRGAGRGMFGGIGAGYKSKNAFDAIGAGIGRYGANADYVNSLDGTSFVGRMRAGTQQRLHIATEEQKIKEKMDAISSFDSAVDSMLKRAEAESIKHNDLEIVYRDANGKVTGKLSMEQHKQEMEQLTRLRNENLNYEEFANARGGDFSETREDFERLQREHDTRLQKLNDKVNKDTKAFATAYATEVAKGKYGKYAANDTETYAYAERVKETHKELEDYFSREEMEKFAIQDIERDAEGNAILDAEGKTIEFFSGENAKQAKQNAVTAKYEIEHNYDGKDGKYNIYQREKANAAATKPKGKK